MKDKTRVVETIMAFFVCTTCITILEGIFGMLFFPEKKIGFDAFFSPPIFGFFSVLFGFILRSEKELNVKQILVRRGIHLLLIEILVHGLNYISGNIFEPFVFWVLTAAIAFIFVMVYTVLWLNDLRNAAIFNEKLKIYQKSEG